ncbi:MAG: AsmA family protein [Devosia sp.]
MLNRLYIVVGVLAIVLLAAAFIVPGFIPWSAYRERMETLAAQALGAPVRITGDIHFSLLPSPHLELTDVSVGPEGHPVMSVKSADADFSLMDFLRDRYVMTRLVLDHPALDLTIGKDGSVETGLKPTLGDSRTALSVANARIAVGTLRLSDLRSGQVYALEGIDGDLTIGALNGPVGFSGGGSFGDQHYTLKLTASAFDNEGTTQVSFYAQPDDGRFSVDLAGALSTAGEPSFTGNLDYRQVPPAGRDPNGVIGDLTLSGKIVATTEQIILPGYTLVPDENRAVTRLAGNATVVLGAQPSFSTSITSAVLSLPPRDATAEQGPQPYELVRMLGELPVLPVPPLPGTVSAEVAQVDLRSFSLHDVKLAAATDGKVWSVQHFAGTLPGGTALQLAGSIGAPDGRPSFSGTLSLATDRLDQLATLWRKPAPDNPLFNMAGAFQSKVSLLGQTMALTDGKLTIAGRQQQLTALINFGEGSRRIDLSGQFGDLDAATSAALVALLPDLAQDQSVGVTFPEGAVSLAADSADFFGIDGKQLALEGKWSKGGIELSKLSAADFGGVGLDLSLAVDGTLSEPHVAGDGTVTLTAAGGPALDRMFDLIGAPQPVRSLLARSLPADLKLHLDDPKNDGSQGLSVSGKAGAADVTLVAQLSQGLLHALGAPFSASLDVGAQDSAALTAQLGLGDVALLPPTGPVKLVASIDGDPAGTLKTQLSATGGEDSISFDGTVQPGVLTAVKGEGHLALALSDTSALVDDAGLAGVAAPPVKGEADVRFEQGRSLTLDNVSGSSRLTGFSGRFSLAASQNGAALSGNLTLDSADIGGLVAALGSPTALMTSKGKRWPDGPISLGDVPRSTTGDIVVETPVLTLGSAQVATDAGFHLAWTATGIGIHKFEAQLGGGTVTADLGLCCAGPAAVKQIEGEAALKGVALDALLPPAAAATLSGTANASGRFNGQGDSVEALLKDLTGDGSFEVTGLTVQKFDPKVFAAIAATPDLDKLEPGDLTQRVSSSLDAGPLRLPRLEGSFTVAGGVLRLPNLGATAEGTRLFGGVTLNLADLGLGGGFSLTPVGTLDAAGVVSETTAKVTAELSGTLAAPVRKLDIASMVSAIKVKALEVEVARLEALKAADDARAAARAKASTAARKEAREDAQAAKLAADQEAARKAAQAAADAAAKKAAADAAAKKAAADAAAKQAAEAAAASRPAPQQRPGPMDLGIPFQ